MRHQDLNWVQPGMYVQQDSFERQLRVLKKEFEVVSFTDVLALWKEGCWDERTRYCILTFDDGWLDNYLYAWPLLRHYAVPATVFLPTSWIGTNRWFWPDRIGFLLYAAYGRTGTRERHAVSTILRRSGLVGGTVGRSVNEFMEPIILALKDWSVNEVEVLIDALTEEIGVMLPKERVLINWIEAQEMSRGGVAFGSHACTHTLLPQLTTEECAEELRESMAAIASHGLNSIPVFCYPNGSYDERIVRQVAQAGYRAAVTTQYGHETGCPANWHALHRIGIHEDVSADEARFIWQIARPDHRVVNWTKSLYS